MTNRELMEEVNERFNRLEHLLIDVATIHFRKTPITNLEKLREEIDKEIKNRYEIAIEQRMGEDL